MNAPVTLQADNESLSTLRDHWFFLLVRIKNEPLAANLLPPLLAFGPQWDAVAKQEQGIEDALTEADAGAVAKDRVLNRLADQVTAGIHEGKKVDLSLPLHKLFYGNKRPFDAKIPVLGPQLTMMTSWPANLASSSRPALQVLAPPVKAGVEEGWVAEAAVTHAAGSLKKFRLDGERRALFDSYNALVATTYGALKAIVHDHPELSLGLDWPESFFRRRQRSRAPSTVKQAEERMKLAENAYLAAKKVHDELVQEQDAAAAEAAAAEAAQQAFDAATKAVAAAAEKQKDAAAALKKAKPKGKKKA